jgi:hypothetical protein
MTRAGSVRRGESSPKTLRVPRGCGVRLGEPMQAFSAAWFLGLSLVFRGKSLRNCSVLVSRAGN